MPDWLTFQYHPTQSGQVTVFLKPRRFNVIFLLHPLSIPISENLTLPIFFSNSSLLFKSYSTILTKNSYHFHLQANLVRFNLSNLFLHHTLLTPPMSVAASPQSSPKQVTQPRAVLASTGNRVRLLDLEWKTQALKKPQRQRKPVTKVPESAVRNNFSVDSSASSDSSSSSSSSSAKKTVAKRTVAKRSGLKTMDVVPRGVGVADVSMKVSGPVKRCDWITPNSGVCIKLISWFCFVLSNACYFCSFVAVWWYDWCGVCLLSLFLFLFFGLVLL